MKLVKVEETTTTKSGRSVSTIKSTYERERTDASYGKDVIVACVVFLVLCILATIGLAIC